MDVGCKHCGSKKRVKNGYVQRKQRYKCKDCNKTYRADDLRERCSNEKRLRVIKWYLEAVGIMSIEGLLRNRKLYNLSTNHYYNPSASYR